MDFTVQTVQLSKILLFSSWSLHSTAFRLYRLVSLQLFLLSSRINGGPKKSFAIQTILPQEASKRRRKICSWPKIDILNLWSLYSESVWSFRAATALCDLDAGSSRRKTFNSKVLNAANKILDFNLHCFGPNKLFWFENWNGFWLIGKQLINKFDSSGPCLLNSKRELIWNLNFECLELSFEALKFDICWEMGLRRHCD